jgi:hypothetical protein
MGHRHTGLPRPECLDIATKRWHHARDDIRRGFGAGDQDRLVVGLPRGILPREPGCELIAGQPGTRPDGVLPQPSVQLDSDASGATDILRRLRGSRQVAGP